MHTIIKIMNVGVAYAHLRCRVGWKCTSTTVNGTTVATFVVFMVCLTVIFFDFHLYLLYLTVCIDDVYKSATMTAVYPGYPRASGMF